MTIGPLAEEGCTAVELNDRKSGATRLCKTKTSRSPSVLTETGIIPVTLVYRPPFARHLIG